MNQLAAVAQFEKRKRQFGVVMAWTIFTTVFVWLPIVRALARPQGYEWGLFGLRGVGLGRSFWIFPLLALYAALLFGHAWWRHRGLFRALLLVWHLGWTVLLTRGMLSQGLAATWQGQGWGFSVPVWIATVVYAGFALYVARWTYLDWRAEEGDPAPRWTAKNTRRLVVALTLLPVVVVLFRLGNDYNWVTALAILVTIIQWITFAEALEATPMEDKAAARA